MTPEERRSLVIYRIQRAKDTLNEAELLLANGIYNTAINRIDYACFYAVNGLLLQDGIEVRTHVGAKNMFGLHFIVTTRLPKHHGQFYSEIFNKRQAGDYDDFITYSREGVEELIPPASQLISDIEILVNQIQN